jgi:hypothetical protein
LSNTFEELFAEAEHDLKKQEIPDEWGYLRQTEEGERILARFLGRDEMPPFNDVVFRFVEYPTQGEPSPFYLKRAAQLEQVLENANVGDIVGIVRGQDKDIGKPNPMQTWAGWTRPCDEPFGGTQTDDGIPFLCLDGRDTRSAATAAAATG